MLPPQLGDVVLRDPRPGSAWIGRVSGGCGRGVGWLVGQSSLPRTACALLSRASHRSRLGRIDSIELSLL